MKEEQGEQRPARVEQAATWTGGKTWGFGGGQPSKEQ